MQQTMQPNAATLHAQGARFQNYQNQHAFNTNLQPPPNQNQNLFNQSLPQGGQPQQHNQQPPQNIIKPTTATGFPTHYNRQRKPRKPLKPQTFVPTFRSPNNQQLQTNPGFGNQPQGGANQQQSLFQSTPQNQNNPQQAFQTQNTVPNTSITQEPNKPRQEKHPLTEAKELSKPSLFSETRRFHKYIHSYLNDNSVGFAHNKNAQKFIMFNLMLNHTQIGDPIASKIPDRLDPKTVTEPHLRTLVFTTYFLFLLESRGIALWSENPGYLAARQNKKYVTKKNDSSKNINPKHPKNPNYCDTWTLPIELENSIIECMKPICQVLPGRRLCPADYDPGTSPNFLIDTYYDQTKVYIINPPYDQMDEFAERIKSLWLNRAMLTICLIPAETYNRDEEWYKGWVRKNDVPTFVMHLETPIFFLKGVECRRLRAAPFPTEIICTGFRGTTLYIQNDENGKFERPPQFNAYIEENYSPKEEKEITVEMDYSKTHTFKKEKFRRTKNIAQCMHIGTPIFNTQEAKEYTPKYPNNEKSNRLIAINYSAPNNDSWGGMKKFQAGHPVYGKSLLWSKINQSRVEPIQLRSIPERFKRNPPPWTPEHEKKSVKFGCFLCHKAHLTKFCPTRTYKWSETLLINVKPLKLLHRFIKRKSEVIIPKRSSLPTMEDLIEDMRIENSINEFWKEYRTFTEKINHPKPGFNIHDVENAAGAGYNNLAHKVAAWRALGAKKHILSKCIVGVIIDVMDTARDTIITLPPRNTGKISKEDIEKALTHEITTRKEINEYRAARVPKKFLKHITHRFVISQMKPNGKKKDRIIWDGRVINASIVADTYKCPTVFQVLASAKNDSEYISLDMSRAYQNIPIAKKSTQYTGFQFGPNNEKFATMLGLPFGLKSSPMHFMMFSNTIARYLANWFGIIYNFIDDFIIRTSITSEPRPIKKERVKFICKLFVRLGFPLSESSKTDPTQDILWLGKFIDIQNDAIFPVAQKINQLLTRLQTLVHNRETCLQELTSIFSGFFSQLERTTAPLYTGLINHLVSTITRSATLAPGEPELNWTKKDSPNHSPITCSQLYKKRFRVPRRLIDTIKNLNIAIKESMKGSKKTAFSEQIFIAADAAIVRGGAFIAQAKYKGRIFVTTQQCHEYDVRIMARSGVEIDIPEHLQNKSSTTRERFTMAEILTMILPDIIEMNNSKGKQIVLLTDSEVLACQLRTGIAKSEPFEETIILQEILKKLVKLKDHGMTYKIEWRSRNTPIMRIADGMGRSVWSNIGYQFNPEFLFKHNLTLDTIFADPKFFAQICNLPYAQESKELWRDCTLFPPFDARCFEDHTHNCTMVEHTLFIIATLKQPIKIILPDFPKYNWKERYIWTWRTIDTTNRMFTHVPSTEWVKRKFTFAEITFV